MPGTSRTALAAAALMLSAGAASAAEHLVEVLGNRFEPAELRIAAGDTVLWVNAEKRTSHSILWTASGEESERIFPGEGWSRTFAQPGRHPYRCGPHPEMQGLVIVE